MPEQLLKLSPHRDLQSYYFQPSAIAAMSGASESGLTLSGAWRQQFDWAVVEWNRDNVFEHPLLRNLPDGDLSGLQLSYLEKRDNCIPMESNLYPSVECPYLRIWAPGGDGNEHIYFVRLRDYAAPSAGAYQNASATMTLTGTVTAGLRVGVAFEGTFASVSLEQHYYYVPASADTLASVASELAAAVAGFSGGDIQASGSGASITFTYVGSGAAANRTGANANRIGIYGYVQSGSAVAWAAPSAVFSGGAFPSRYAVALNFSALQGVMDDPTGFFQATIPYVPVPTSRVRKMRWTWAADMQPSSFARSEFSVAISNWSVTGTGRAYSVAGPGSRRIEDDDPAVTYSSTASVSDWLTEPPGNFSGSRIHVTSQIGATCAITYSEAAAHQLYLGSRLLASGPSITISIDGGTPIALSLNLPGEDVLVRLPLGAIAAGSHSIVIAHIGPAADPANNLYYPLYFDFLEIAYPSSDLPGIAAQPQLALATDWDTLHSQSLAAERTAWMIWKLGFNGRVNHYTGALWFYELFRPGQVYASLTITVTVPSGGPSGYTEVDIGVAPSVVTIQHLNLPDDTDANISTALALLINQGTNAIWASAAGNVVTVTARTMGAAGDGLEFSTPSGTGNVTLSLSSSTLSGGVDGVDSGFDASDPNGAALISKTQFWRTDLAAMPRVNRACRDWSQAFFTALHGYGLDAVAAFSTELANVDPTTAAGMAQRYVDGTPVTLNTPAIQTNFSPTSLAFWSEVYVEMAALMDAAGLVPYLQSGEVQWWYFAKQIWAQVDGQYRWIDAGVGMPFYDAYTQQQFAAQYGVPMQTMLSNQADPALYPNETAFLPALIGAYTFAIRAAVKAHFPAARFEVLYPVDVNATPLNQVVNFAGADWTPANLNCLKTESFTYTYARNLDLSFASISLSAQKGFSALQSSHLVGAGDAKTAWMKEVNLAQSQGLESVVVFALDQYCLIGYPLPPFAAQGRSMRAG